MIRARTPLARRKSHTDIARLWVDRMRGISAEDRAPSITSDELNSHVLAAIRQVGGERAHVDAPLHPAPRMRTREETARLRAAVRAARGGRVCGAILVGARYCAMAQSHAGGCGRRQAEVK